MKDSVFISRYEVESDCEFMMEVEVWGVFFDGDFFDFIYVGLFLNIVWI